VNNHFYKVILNNIHDGVFFLDHNLKISSWNKAAENITGFNESEVINNQCPKNILIQINEDKMTLCKENCPVKQTLIDGRIRNKVAYFQHKEGYRIPVNMCVLPIADNNKNIIEAAVTFYDTSPRVIIPQRTQELARMGLLDPLTKLGNRTYLDMHIGFRLNEMNRYQLHFGIILISMDQLKTVNEIYGRESGNKLLKTVIQTITSNIRFFDITGRWGGEKFVVLVLNIDETKLDFVSNKLCLLISQSSTIVGSEILRTTVSIGATLARQNDTTATLSTRAEELLQHSKRLGKNRVTLRIEEEKEPDS